MTASGPANPTPDGEASKLNRELTGLLVGAGRRAGLEAVTEFAVPGGRLDVVWLWRPPVVIPGVETALPVVGFEIESSWRTRKHVKGDLLNLQDAGVALGVIVLAGDTEKDQSLRRFAQLLVERPGSRVLVWTVEDVRMLARSDTPEALLDVAEQDPATTAPRPSGSSADHRGKYRPLWAWLQHQPREATTMTFAEVERIIGFPLPGSCRVYEAHWHSYDGSAVARAIIDAGWRASTVRTGDEMVTFLPT